MVDYQTLPPGLNTMLHNGGLVDPKDFQVNGLSHQNLTPFYRDVSYIVHSADMVYTCSRRHLKVRFEDDKNLSVVLILFKSNIR